MEHSNFAPECKRNSKRSAHVAHAPSTDHQALASNWVSIGDVARGLVKGALVTAYCHGALSVSQTQRLIDALRVNEA